MTVGPGLSLDTRTQWSITTTLAWSYLVELLQHKDPDEEVAANAIYALSVVVRPAKETARFKNSLATTSLCPPAGSGPRRGSDRRRPHGRGWNWSQAGARSL